MKKRFAGALLALAVALSAVVAPGAGAMPYDALDDEPTYSVRYAGNGGTGAAMADPGKLPGELVAVAANTYAPPPRATFKEWNTARNGLGTGYAPGSTLAMPTPGSDLVLYAIWEYGGYPTFYNNPSALPSNAADPQVLYDKSTGYYYAYSTDGAMTGYRFGIYRSPDLATWERLNGAIPTSDPNTWANDWFWAPECYYNENNGYYYLFYSGRMTNQANAEAHFGFRDFEEACKTGVAVSRSPEGPFYNITNGPIDYYPYDPQYHDVNQIMSSPYRLPPATLAAGEQAPLGVYIPFIDANVFFDDDGRIYLYYSRNAYRNWVWDYDLGKYVEESNIYVVELDTDWWTAAEEPAMPTVKSSYVNQNKAAGDATPSRKDGFIPVINYGGDKQEWENAHVNDYASTGGSNKDRRWSEGSFIMKYEYDKDGTGAKPYYYIIYSCNNYANQYYGEGYAVSESPLGPFAKSSANPFVARDLEVPVYSTGHGNFIASPDGTELFHVYHGRSTSNGNRRMYTNRIFFDETLLSDGLPTLAVVQSKGDQPLPSGVAPLGVELAEDTAYDIYEYGAGNDRLAVNWSVHAADGGKFTLGSSLNRVAVSVSDSSVATFAVTTSGTNAWSAGTLTFLKPGSVDVTVTYLRQMADGTYAEVYNPVAAGAGAGAGPELVSVTRTFAAYDRPDTSAGIAAPAKLDIDGAPQLDYSIGVAKAEGANLIQVKARFDGARLDYAGSAIADGTGFSFLVAPSYDPATGAYAATLAILQANASFSTDSLAEVLSVGFTAKAGAVAHGDVLQASLESVMIQTQSKGATNAVDAKLLPKDAATVAESFLRWDAVDGKGGGPDGKLDMSDISYIIYNYYLSAEGGPLWEEAKRFDANGDGIVDLADLLIIMSFM